MAKRKIKLKPKPTTKEVKFGNVKQSWIALFSQSGSEIANLAKALGYWPNLIITNNSDKSKWDPRIVSRTKFSNSVMVVSNHQAKTANFLHNVRGSTSALITLHGWLRIIPPDISINIKL